MDRNNQRYLLATRNGIQNNFLNFHFSKAKKKKEKKKAISKKKYIIPYTFIYSKFSEILLLCQTQAKGPFSKK